MNELFDKLPEDKKNKILSACVEEFAYNGYEKASTNMIVKKAGISKGLLFHYFGSKKNVFLYVLDYVNDYILDKYYSQTDTMPSDLFERMMWVSLLKIKMWNEERLKFKLIFNAFVSLPEELKQEIESRYLRLNKEHMPRFFEGIDTSKLRDGIDINKAIEMIMLFIEGFSNKYISQYKNQSADEMLESMNKLIDELDGYFNIIKGGIYRV
ncbi:MAG: TetR/AcrR family transcriptional regulator [Deltaproteobacteria bacterium]